jgi:hypothetical protein
MGDGPYKTVSSNQCLKGNERPFPDCAVIVVEFSKPVPPADLKAVGSKVASSIWEDFKTTNKSAAGTALRFGGTILIGAKIAKYYETLTPLSWALKGFGALPGEFTASGAIQWRTLSAGARFGRVALTGAATFALVMVAFEGGVLIGSVINQHLSEETKDAIGGTINEIVNEGGWKLLWEHPFGIGM